MIAGKYAQLMANPVASMALGGGIAAGASLLGNQGEDKSPGRQALEALGAGALGAGVGRMLPAVYARSAKRSQTAARNLADELGGVQSPMSGSDRADAQMRAEQLKVARELGATDEILGKSMQLELGGRQALTNAAAAAGGLGLATGLGGIAGGGVANIGNMAGLGIDPESPGSSNTTNSRVSMQGGGYMPMY